MLYNIFLNKISLKKYVLLASFLALCSCFNTTYTKIKEDSLKNQDLKAKQNINNIYQAHTTQSTATILLQNNTQNLNTTYGLLLDTTALINLMPTLDNVYNLLSLATPIGKFNKGIHYNALVFINEPLKLVSYDEVQNVCVFNYNQQYQFALSLNNIDKDCKNYSNNIVIKKEKGIYSYTNSTLNIISVDNYSFAVKPTDVQLKYYIQAKQRLLSLFKVDIVIDKNLLNSNYLLKSKYVIYLRYINDYANNKNYDNYYNHYNFLINKHLMLKDLWNIYNDQQTILIAQLEDANKKMESIDNSNINVYKNQNSATTTTNYCDKNTFICLKTTASNNVADALDQSSVYKQWLRQDITLDVGATIAYLITFPISIPISVILLLTSETSPFIINDK